MNDRELMREVLEALDYEAERGHDDGYRQLRDALRERLAQPEQEPVFDCPRCGHCCPRSRSEPPPVKESSVTHGHLWIGDLYGKGKDT